MIVADSSGLVALGSVEVIEPFVTEFDVWTTPETVDSIEAKSARHGPDGEGARAALSVTNQIGVTAPNAEPIVTTRLDRTSGSAVVLARDRDARYHLTDERRAMHELRQLVPGDVVTPWIALEALVRTAGLRRQDARFRLDGLLDRARGLEAAVGNRGHSLIQAE